MIKSRKTLFLEVQQQHFVLLLQELKLLLHRSTLLKTQGQLHDYLDAVISMISMLLKVVFFWFL